MPNGFGTVGVFCDRSGSISTLNTKALGCYDFGQGQLRQWDVGHWQSVADTQAALENITLNAIVIGNHAEAYAGMDLRAPNTTWSGKMFEHFVPSRPYLPPVIDQLTGLKQAGEHHIIAEAHVDFCRVDTGQPDGKLLDMYKRSLAAFLIGASNYSYYACTNGWGYDNGWELWPADYDRPLGAPLGHASRNSAGVWRRDFALNTSVFLATSDQTDDGWGSSCIRWGDGHVTRSGKLC